MLQALLVALALQNPDANAILDRSIAAYRRVTTLRADFTQALRDPMIGTDDTSYGELFQRRPDRFAMRWTRPRGDLLVVDGSYLWLYLPSSVPNQVVKSAVSGRPGQSPDVIAEFLDAPRERFTVAYVGSQSVGGRSADVLSFTPKQANAPYRRVVLWLDTQDHLPHQFEITEASGAVRRVTLSRLRVNTAIPASTFTFRAPAGVRVVDASQ
jgi:outer membrane lipoprotein carrier protein